MEAFTRMPNSIIDTAKLNPYQFQLFTIIVRKTDGWCKVEDGISLSQFEKLVTFKRPKIISSLKELIDLDLIEKRKQILDNNSNSYNMYKISKRVVTENNKGSNSQLLGVVSEDYKQKKPITKETNTIKKPFDLFINYLKEKAPIKSKVTTTKETKKYFDLISDKNTLIVDYLNHQKEKKEFSQRLTAFLMDYVPPKKIHPSKEYLNGWTE